MLGVPYCVMQIKHYENLVSNYPQTLYELTDPPGLPIPITSDPFDGLAVNFSPVSFLGSEAEPSSFPWPPKLIPDDREILNHCSEGYPELGAGPDLLVTYPQWSSSVF